ncbi:MAG: DUF6763 family protein [Gammaproteobacteria bacterium]
MNAPEIGRWYRTPHGEPFVVVAIESGTDENEGGIEIQHFDGTLEEIEHSEWGTLLVQSVAAPEDYSGALDLGGESDAGIGLIAEDEGNWIDPMSVIDRL